MTGRLVPLLHLRISPGRVSLGQQLLCQAKIGDYPGLGYSAELTQFNG